MVSKYDLCIFLDKLSIRSYPAIVYALLVLAAVAAWPPIIDVHHHAVYPGVDPVTSRERVLSNLRVRPLRKAVIEVMDYEQLADWANDPQDRFIVGVPVGCPRALSSPRYECFPSDEGWPDLEWLEAKLAGGSVEALHELGPSYSGWQIGNPRYDPYLALAHRYDVPIGIHSSRGPAPGQGPRKDSGRYPNYDPDASNPGHLRPVLEKYKGLRVWLQHVGSGRGDHGPYMEETLSLLADYPSVYVDLSVTNSVMPIEQYEETLRMLIDAGFGDRIMFGSDNYFSDAIIDRMNSIAWLEDAQKRAILHDNAARFFRLRESRGK